MTKPDKRFRLLLLALFAVALSVRLVRPDWDDGHHFHPDERRIAEAVLHITFRPLQLDPDFFAYGSFPFYVTRTVTAALGALDQRLGTYDAVILTGRCLSALWGALAVVLLVLLGRRLYGERVGLLAGLLLAATVLHVQSSHFGVNDIFLTTLVLAALLCLVRVVEEGHRPSLAAAGALTGLALATKVSALPLLLPLGLAVLVVARHERRASLVVRLGALAGLPVAAAFLLGEPYAVINFGRFFRDVHEQSEMVRTAGLYAYTNQYLGVPRYLYDLQQLVLWGMGPALGLAALWGTLLRLGRAVRAPRAAEWLLLVWVVPFFVITGFFEVKFIRYLLPIYPLVVLWGAAWLEEIAEQGRVGRFTRAAVVAVTAAYLLAFLSIYTRPHTEVAASEWFYRHVKPGTRVVTQDWDEGFPLPLEGRSGDAYTIVPFPYYDEDTSTKIDHLSKELASAEVMVLQTKRLYGAITRAAAKYPLTDRYFRLLFAGDLGYRLERDFSSRPQLLGISLPSELADESFSVYDHPKVLLFRNADHLAAEEIRERILHGIPSRPLSRSDLLLAHAGGPVESAEPIRSSVPATLLVALLLETLALATYSLLRAAGWTGPGVYSLAKVLGVLLFAWPVWLLTSLGLLSFRRPVLLGWLVLLAGAAVVAWRRRRGEEPPRAEVVASEVACWGAFLLFLALRAGNPEIYWGEKPMDFSFLNALYRITTLPPPEPWFAGSSLSYSYFGHFIVAALGKTVHVHPALMFNLAIAAVAALTAAAFFAAATLLARQWQAGAVTTAFSLLVGNLAILRELPARKVLSFDYFWATSRVIPNTINEFPFWSLSFADLHAHLLAMPFTVTLVALLAAWWSRPARGQPGSRLAGGSILACSALVFGAISVTNGWSVPTSTALLLGLLALAWWSEARPPGLIPLTSSALGRLVLPAATVLGGAWLAYRPFWAHFSPPGRSWGLEQGPYAGPIDYLTIFGAFLVVLVPFLFLAWHRRLVGEGGSLSRGQRIAMVSVGVALLLTLVDLGALGRLVVRPAVSVAPLALVLALLALSAAPSSSTPRRFRAPLALAGLAFLLTAGCELVFVWDRMNTVFKYYLDAWLLLALAAGLVTFEVFRGALRGGRAAWLWRGAITAAVAVGLATSLTGAWGLLTDRHVAGPRLTLDGMAYLAKLDPADLAAFRWLNRSVRGTPVLCEAYGPSYQQYSRVSMNTGLPIVLGWDYHVFQRGQSWERINARKQDLETIYTSDDEAAVASILRRYHVALLYAGPLERETYGPGARDRFAAWDDLLSPVYRTQQVAIFAVKGAPLPIAPDAVVDQHLAAEESAAEAPTGDRPGKLRQPRGLACDRAGNVVVCDFGNDRLQKLDPTLAPVAVWGRKGKAPGQFDQPCAVAIGPDEAIYVADTWNGRVQVLDSSGKAVREWQAGLYGPRGIAVGPDGSVYVADTGNGRILRFSAGGELQLEWGGEGSEPGKMRGPVGVAVDRNGMVYVCDNDNGRLQLFHSDGSLVRAFPVAGWRREVFSEPQVAVAAEGTIWVSVPLEGEVRAYTPDGRLLRTVRLVSHDGSPSRPCGVALRPDGRALVVADTTHDLVGVIELASP